MVLVNFLKVYLKSDMTISSRVIILEITIPW